MPKREPKAGDYFLQPFAGRQRDLLVRVVEYHHSSGHWYVRTAKDGENGPIRLCFLSSCARVSPARAARILGVAACPVPGTVNDQGDPR